MLEHVERLGDIGKELDGELYFKIVLPSCIYKLDATFSQPFFDKECH